MGTRTLGKDARATNGKPHPVPVDQRGDAWEPPPEYVDEHPGNAESPGESGDRPKPDATSLPIVPCSELLRKYPNRRPAVIEELLREGETMNIIAAPKLGKSWLSLGLAFAVAMGEKWLGRFTTVQGNVLLIDNELHPETSAHRLRVMAHALGVPHDFIAKTISIINLRGKLKDLGNLGTGLLKIPHGLYRLTIIDAFYRAMPIGADENDNGTMASLYNMLDFYAESMGSAFSLIHHTTKGSQSSKAVTDVGAGAGAQSRATDTHLILRPHEENNAVVLDAAARSWPPIAAMSLRWEFPLWKPAADLDPTALRPDKPPRKKKDDAEDKPKDPPWSPKRFADTFGKPEPRASASIVEDAVLVGLSQNKAQQLLRAALDCGYLFGWKEGGANTRTLIATAKPAEPEKEAETPVKPKRRKKVKPK